MNHFDGKFLALLLVLIQSTSALDKDVTLSIGVSVISTLTVCAILSLIAWNCCLRSQGARKHQFDAEQDCNKGVVLANYDNILNTAKPETATTLQCPKCGHRIERNTLTYDGSSDGRRINSVKNKSNGCKGTSVEVVVHNNSRSMNSTTETTCNTQKLETNKEESSTVLAIEERSTFEVKLKKTETGSLGLSIVGGRCSRLGDIGVFIKSTIENTPAASNGLLTPWDQILKVNNIDLDGKTLEEALMVIKEQSDDITLTILPSEQATAHLEASLSIKAAQLDENRMRADWSSLREADEITPDGNSEPDKGSNEVRSDTSKSTGDVTKSRDVNQAKACADSTEISSKTNSITVNDAASVTSSLPLLASSYSKRSVQTAPSSREIPDSEISLGPIHETDLVSKDDDVFFAPSPTTPKGLFSGVGLTNVTNSRLGGESNARRADHVIEGAERGFRGTLETDSIRVDLDSEIQPIGQDIIVQ